MTIRAPYNFVPLSRWVYQPPWAKQVSHDVPFEDGLSGVISYSLTADTPILVGGKQDNRGGKGPTAVRFFQRPDGKYAIPGSSVRGMIRGVLEIASFGKMKAVDDQRLSIRDIIGPHVKTTYSNRILGADYAGHRGPRAGFLLINDEGGADLIPCKFARVSHRDMESYCGWTGGAPIFTKGMKVQKKYDVWREELKKSGKISANYEDELSELPKIDFDVDEPENASDPTLKRLAKNLGTGKDNGVLVFTGQVSDRRDDKPKQPGRPQSKGKYLDFIFYDDEDFCYEVDDRVLREFREIHGEWETDKTDRPWRDFWQGQFRKDLRVPVFYRESAEGVIESIGLAYMYRLAYDYSISDLVRRTAKDHQDPKSWDFCETLFGRVENMSGWELGKDCISDLKGRVGFGLATLTNSVNVVECPPTITNSPKPSFFPNYVTQSTGRLQKGEQYRTYMDGNAEIRGWKRYPVKGSGVVQSLTPEQVKNTAVQSKLFPLGEGAQFSGVIRFHNLKPEEVGALIWAITWGGNGKLRHSLGMGSSFGFGQVKMDVDVGSWAESVRSNNFRDAPSAAGCSAAFEKVMSRVYLEHASDEPNKSWRDSVQMIALTLMANPGAGEKRKGNLQHMTLAVSGRNNEFSQAKKNGEVLPCYTAVAEKPDNARRG